MKPTAEQAAILEAVRTTQRNLLINARAGAAKTTTLTMIAEALPEQSVLAIAFNKKIADELRTRLPDNAESATLNALGHRAWRSYLGKHLKVDSRKTYYLLREALAELSPEEREEIDEDFSDLLRAIREAKQEGYMPGKLHAQAKPLIADESFFDLLDFETGPLHRQIIDAVLTRSFTEAMQGKIDFDDQIYCPAIMSCSFDPYDTTLVDEAQDLSHINHVLLRKIVKRKRLIAVGDPCQAIYGFRGASENSMEELRTTFGMSEHFLTVCFRSAQSVVENARWRAPDMQYREGAPAGLVETLDRWSPADLKPGDAVICRNNAPLFALAIQLLSAGVNPELASGDIVPEIEKVMKKLGKPTRTSAEAELALAAWFDEQKAKRKRTSGLADTRDCILVLLRNRTTLGEALDFLRQITSVAGRVHLMTGHKSKGLEFDRVWFLDRHLLAPKGQDRNVRYVIETRARNELRYVTSDALHMGLDNIAAA